MSGGTLDGEGWRILEKQAVLNLYDISKSFPGVKALDHMKLQLQKGEVMAIAGENGAGKSTLIKILSGVYIPDEGIIELDGSPVAFKDPRQAEAAGIYTVHQELSVFTQMNIAENIFANRLPQKKNGTIDYRALFDRTHEILQSFEMQDISPRTIVGTLDIARQQAVEIMRATAFSPKILILDEPTSALTTHDTQLLFRVIKKLKQIGTSVIYISHRLEEIFEICDSVTIVRDGMFIDTKPIGQITHDEIVRKMVGRDVAFNYGRDTSQAGEEILRVENVTSGAAVKDVSFSLCRGEVVGIGGLEGSGRTELLETLFGMRSLAQGTIRIKGEEKRISSPQEARKNGIAYITKDRKKVGLFIRMSIEQNILGGNLSRFSKNGRMLFKQLHTEAEACVDRYDVRTTSVRKLVNALSGGNQQKVMLSMWLLSAPEIILVDEPTRGIDVGTKEYIHKVLREMAKEGCAVLMVSSDMPELLSASDRIIVMSNGRIAGELTGEERTEINVMRHAVKNMQHKQGGEGVSAV